VEDTGEEGPAEGDVGDEDGGGGFADVPVEVDEGAVGFGEVVVAVEDCGEDLEGAVCVSGRVWVEGEVVGDNLRRRYRD